MRTCRSSHDHVGIGGGNGPENVAYLSQLSEASMCPIRGSDANADSVDRRRNGRLRKLEYHQAHLHAPARQSASEQEDLCLRSACRSYLRIRQQRSEPRNVKGDVVSIPRCCLRAHLQAYLVAANTLVGAIAAIRLQKCWRSATSPKWIVSLPTAPQSSLRAPRLQGRPRRRRQRLPVGENSRRVHSLAPRLIQRHRPPNTTSNALSEKRRPPDYLSRKV
jgi:hypothetical protein